MSIYKPNHCVDCGKEHIPTETICGGCRSWTLPTRNPENREERIVWKIFIINKTDSNQVKTRQFNGAEKAMKKGRYTAILGASAGTKPVIFLCRSGGQKVLSYTNDDGSVSREYWETLGPEVWDAFQGMVGLAPLPDTFPRPALR